MSIFGVSEDKLIRAVALACATRYGVEKGLSSGVSNTDRFTILHVAEAFERYIQGE